MRGCFFGIFVASAVVFAKPLLCYKGTRNNNQRIDHQCLLTRSQEQLVWLTEVTWRLQTPVPLLILAIKDC